MQQSKEKKKKRRTPKIDQMCRFPSDKNPRCNSYSENGIIDPNLYPKTQN